MSNYSGVEGQSISVCVTVHSPNATILSMSDFEGQFRVTGNGECLIRPKYTILNARHVLTHSNYTDVCVNNIITPSSTYYALAKA